jgi:accessory colonization factor AcfC
MSGAHSDGADSKNQGGVDIHGDPIIQKYATMDEVVTVTKNVKRFVHYSGGKSVIYSNNAIKNLHNHH